MGIRKFLFLHIFVLPQDNKTLHYRCEGCVLVRPQLGPLSVSQQDWGSVRLESSDSLGFTSLSHHINSLSDTNRDWQRLEVLVESDQHAGLDCRDQVIKEIVRFA